MPDKQLPIPGLEPSFGSPGLEFSRPRKPTGCQMDLKKSLEERVAALEVELSVLKIQLEA